MFAAERHEEIARTVTRERRVNGAELARRFEVTMETIRRDLAVLESQGRLRRVHGGAVSVDQSTSGEQGMDSRHRLATAQKHSIALKALELLEDAGAGAVVLDAGTTVEALAELMLSRNNHLEGGQEQLVITHALHIAAKLADAEGVGLELVGGRIRKLTWAATGSRAAQHYDQLRPDLAFVGCNGAHARFGLSTPDPIEAVVKSAIVTAARRVVVLCDASKQDQETLTRFCSLEQIDTFITDRAPMGDLAQALEDADVEVVVA
ncbi:DeoR/GlpR family DNA-binding transcription regulator [Kocuria rhizophila]|uniref:DeoR/GlpR family DNA-binding transcription regulator n=1 Tax=Kocuria rhizophila TaxID=72000 RepID=UPI00387A2D77